MKKKFTGNTRLFLCISGAIIAVALIMQIFGVGLNLGIDFTGGSILSYSVGEDYDVNDVEAILNASGYSDNQITKAAPSAASIALQERLAAEGIDTIGRLAALTDDDLRRLTGDGRKVSDLTTEQYADLIGQLNFGDE